MADSVLGGSFKLVNGKSTQVPTPPCVDQADLPNSDGEQLGCSTPQPSVGAKDWTSSTERESLSTTTPPSRTVVFEAARKVCESNMALADAQERLRELELEVAALRSKAESKDIQPGSSPGIAIEAIYDRVNWIAPPILLTPGASTSSSAKATPRPPMVAPPADGNGENRTSSHCKAETCQSELNEQLTDAKKVTAKAVEKFEAALPDKDSEGLPPDDACPAAVPAAVATLNALHTATEAVMNVQRGASSGEPAFSAVQGMWTSIADLVARAETLAKAATVPPDIQQWCKHSQESYAPTVGQFPPLRTQYAEVKQKLGELVEQDEAVAAAMAGAVELPDGAVQASNAAKSGYNILMQAFQQLVEATEGAGLMGADLQTDALLKERRQLLRGTVGYVRPTVMCPTTYGTWNGQKGSTHSAPGRVATTYGRPGSVQDAASISGVSAACTVHKVQGLSAVCTANAVDPIRGRCTRVSPLRVPRSIVRAESENRSSSPLRPAPAVMERSVSIPGHTQAQHGRACSPIRVVRYNVAAAPRRPGTPGPPRRTASPTAKTWQQTASRTPLRMRSAQLPVTVGFGSVEVPQLLGSSATARAWTVEESVAGNSRPTNVTQRSGTPQQGLTRQYSTGEPAQPIASIASPLGAPMSRAACCRTPGAPPPPTKSGPGAVGRS